MSIKNKTKDRNRNGRIKRKYTGPYTTGFHKQTPKWWMRAYMTRPKKLESRRLCRQILLGGDYDGMTFPLGNRKPHEFYW